MAFVEHDLHGFWLFRGCIVLSTCLLSGGIAGGSSVALHCFKLEYRRGPLNEWLYIVLYEPVCWIGSSRNRLARGDDGNEGVQRFEEARKNSEEKRVLVIVPVVPDAVCIQAV